MTAYIQFHTRARVREGELDDFLDVATRFVEAVESEPGADSCACYVDRETRTVSFFEIFHDVDAFLAHFEHPPAAALVPEMNPKIEEFERIELFGDVPADVLDGLADKRFAVACAPEHAAFVGKDR